ncbi:MAG: glycosyltransferase, partial [Chloroflexota bacterium]
MPRTLVVIPTYNEKENLANMVAALFALEIDDLSVLVVDDNSPDGTGQIADDLVQQHPGRMHVLHREGKGGLGRAYIAGWRYAIENLDVDYLIQMDADFSHQPKYVPQLIHKMSEGYDVVMASRYVTGGSVEEEWGVYRKLLSWFAN